MSIVDDEEILCSATFNFDLNDKLNPKHISIPENDKSISSRFIRSVVKSVSNIFTPRKIIVLLRLLRALTICLLCLTIAADLMYIFFVNLMSSKDVSVKLGGFRDLVIRIYGAGLGILAVIIELNKPLLRTLYPGLKPFIPRSLLLFFVSTLTTPSPLLSHGKKISSSVNSNEFNQYDGDGDSHNSLADQIPDSSIIFQTVTSLLLGFCALLYLLLGILCLDRFTSRAFISDRDPVTSTAIPQKLDSLSQCDVTHTVIHNTCYH